jgi:hypothetical protein
MTAGMLLGYARCQGGKRQESAARECSPRAHNGLALSDSERQTRLLLDLNGHLFILVGA